MFLELSDEQRMLSEAAADAIGRHETIAAARAAADGAEPLDLWPTAVEAGWAGLVSSEAAGGAGLGIFEAMLVAEQCGKRLASAGLLGHLPAALIVQRAADGGSQAAASLLTDLAGGAKRAAALHTAPPARGESWTVDGTEGRRLPAFALADGAVSGTAGFQPDAAGADVLIGAALDDCGGLVAFAVEVGTPGLGVEPVAPYDPSRPLAHVRADDAAATVLGAGEAAVREAWSLAQALLGADALGVAEAAREMALAYARERHTFGRPIGSYQAVKHNLVEMLRLASTARSLTYYAGLAESSMPDQLERACLCVRAAGEKAAGYSTRMNIATHGGIGVTWEHDAPFFWRRAQLSRLIVGGEAEAVDRVAESVIAAAGAGAPEQSSEPVAV